MKLIVTTSMKASGTVCSAAKQWTHHIGGIFVERWGKSLERLTELSGGIFIVYTAKGPQLYTPQGKHGFSLQLAELRIKKLRRGERDYLIEAFDMRQAGHILDCTCGLGADAITASFGLPLGTRVTALENSPYLGVITAWGFQHYRHEKEDVTAALRRIRFIAMDYQIWLRRTSEYYDVIYFDPMFAHPVLLSSNFKPLRNVVTLEPITKEIIDLALTKASRVVIKTQSTKWIQSWFPWMENIGGKYSHIQYAVLKGGSQAWTK